MCIETMVAALIYNWVDYITQSFRYRFIGFNVYRKPGYRPPLAYFLSGNLYNIIIKNTQPCCFCIENNNILLFKNLNKALYIRCGIITQKISR